MPVRHSNLLAGASLRAREAVVRVANQPLVQVRDGPGLVVDVTQGSLEVGRLIALAAMGGLARLSLGFEDWGPHAVPAITVETGTPLEACLGCQYAGWHVKVNKFSAMGSGPGRLKVAKEEVLARYRLSDPERGAVFLLETRDPVDAPVLEYLAAQARVPLSDLAVIQAPTASLVGSVQVAARVVETALHQWELRGGDLRAIRAAMGRCPIAPVAPDDSTAIGWTNDAMLYAGRVWLWVDEDDAVIERLVKDTVAQASPAWGTPFTTLFQEAHGNFYEIDPGLFAPAVIQAVSLKSGRAFRAGVVHHRLLEELWQWPSASPS
ncbi:MAG: methenyltetrahydromethanopterin cyclohydrolase [Firmicutes bacterium]|nr:methenyltetrahydromethanopterin cyclohydrolase [Bacillota bacterium]